jgi:hypothetical protein
VKTPKELFFRYLAAVLKHTDAIDKLNKEYAESKRFYDECALNADYEKVSGFLLPVSLYAVTEGGLERSRCADLEIEVRKVMADEAIAEVRKRKK